jgi:hypothetical protein
MDILSVADMQNSESQHETSPLRERYVRSQSVVSRRIGGESLIVPVRGKVGDLASIYSFNGSGTLLWESLASSQSFTGLAEILEHEYTVEHAQAAHDVKQFLNDAMNAGLIEIREEVADGRLVSGHAFTRAEEAVV